MKGGLNKWYGIPFSWIEKLSILKMAIMAIFLEFIYKFSVILSKS